MKLWWEKRVGNLKTLILQRKLGGTHLIKMLYVLLKDIDEIKDVHQSPGSTNTQPKDNTSIGNFYAGNDGTCVKCSQLVVLNMMHYSLNTIESMVT